jgi:hypothetical protein
LSKALFPDYFISHQSPQDLQLLDLLGIKVLRRSSYFKDELLQNVSNLFETFPSEVENDLLIMLTELNTLTDEDRQFVNHLKTIKFLPAGIKIDEDDINIYNEINQKIVENATNIFENSEKESEFTVQSVKELFDSITNSLQIPEDSVFYKQIKEVNNYFDSFTNRTILNWHVIIENTFKFNINQGRIINSIYSVVG